jgi:hypothetical protein
MLASNNSSGSTSHYKNITNIGQHLTPKRPWLCFFKNIENLPLSRSKKGKGKKEFFLRISTVDLVWH